jgi:hypothetical protein
MLVVPTHLCTHVHCFLERNVIFQTVIQGKLPEEWEHLLYYTLVNYYVNILHVVYTCDYLLDNCEMGERVVIWYTTHINKQMSLCITVKAEHSTLS